jgi:tyrosyl-tRNA synthetase
MIGDPTGKSQTRPMLSPAEIQRNADTYFAQAGHVLDTSPQRCEIRRNSEWLAKMSFADVLRLASRKTVARMLERDTFEKRFKAGQEIGVHELLYPLMQGWDSVCIHSDVELGGSDQTFNNLVGRDLQRLEGQEPQIVLIMPILAGLDGKEKMSKSLGNYIGVTEEPPEMFAKLMSIPDEQMVSYCTLLTDLDPEAFRRESRERPRDAKVGLARTIIGQLHAGADTQRLEQEFFGKMKGDLPEDIPDQGIAAAEINAGHLPAVRLAVLCGFASSNGDARRLILEGGLRLNQEKLTDPNTSVPVRDGDVVQRGKRRFVRIRIH